MNSANKTYKKKKTHEPTSRKRKNLETYFVTKSSLHRKEEKGRQETQKAKNAESV
jgi:hypothetical protein